MKLEDWKLQPLKKSGSKKGAVTTTTSDGIKVQTMVANCQAAAGQSVFHIHFQLMGGRNFTWPPG